MSFFAPCLRGVVEGILRMPYRHLGFRQRHEAHENLNCMTLFVLIYMLDFATAVGMWSVSSAARF